MVATKLKERLESAGFSVEKLLSAVQAGEIRGPLQVCKSMDGSIGVITMADGCFFEGLTCWLDSVPVLIAKEVAQDWDILKE